MPVQSRCKCFYFLVAILATGCGGGSTDSNSGQETVTAPAQEVSDVNLAESKPVSATCSDTPTSDGFGISTCSPSPGAKFRALVTQVEVNFTSALLPETVNSTSIYLSQNEAPVPATLKQSNDGGGVLITPDTALNPDTRYQVHISEAVMSVDGVSFPGAQWTFTTAEDVGTTTQTVIDSCMSEWDVQMLAEINEARSRTRQCGEAEAPAVAPVSWSCTIEKVAHSHSRDMARFNFFSHTGSDGTSAGDRLTEGGYRWQTWSENIAAGQTSIKQVMEELLASPGHCENIMNPRFTEVGAALVENETSDYGKYWTQNFARPLN